MSENILPKQTVMTRRKKMDLIKTIEEKQKKPNAETFKVGDTVKVHFEIIEGKTKRIQIFEGLVICMKNFRNRQDIYCTQDKLRCWC